MNTKRCLIVDQMHSSIVPMLESIGFQVDYFPDISREDVLKIIENYKGIIVRSKLNINKEILDKARNLKFIGRAGAGLDQIDVAAVAERDIIIVNAPEGNRDAVAEHCIALILCLFNKILVGDKQVRGGIWQREANRGLELMGKTVSLIGYGFMGQAFSKRLASFGCKVLAYDKYKSGFSNSFVKEASMEEIYEKTDVLSLHIPLSHETRGMINDEFIDRFKNPFFFVNTARGEIARLSAIRNALEKGKLLGAGLDVLENEKINEKSAGEDENLHYLFNSEKVIFTPHVAGWTSESYIKINEVLASKIASLGNI